MICGQLEAQPTPARISGRVVSAVSGEPLPGARVSVSGAQRATITDSAGAFHLDDLRPGDYVLEVSFIGHLPLHRPVRLTAAERLRLDVALTISAIPLRGVDVEAHRDLSPQIIGFQERRERGTGFYFTAADIEAMQARVVTDVLRRVPGAEVQSLDGRYGTNHAVRMNRTRGAAGARECDTVFYVDGSPFAVTSDIGIDAYVAVRDVEAVEVYSGASRIPAQFNTGQLSSRCGVVVIWTRTGPHD